MEAVAEEAVIGPVGRLLADGNHCDVIDKEHDDGQNREAQPAVRDNLVDLVRNRHAAFVRLMVAALQQLRDIDIAFARDDGLRVVVQFLLRRRDVLFDMMHLVGGNVQFGQNLFIPFEDLDGVPTLPFRRHVVQFSLLDVGDGMLHRSGEGVHRKRMRLFGGFDGRFGGFHDAVVVQRGDFQHFAAQFARQLLEIDLVAVLPDDVHHVHGNDHRDAELRQLRRQIEVALQIRAVDDVQNRLGGFVQQIISCDDLLQRVG